MLDTTDSGASVTDDPPESAGPAARSRFGIGWLVGAVVFGVLVGLLAGLLVPRLTRPGNDSAEAGFLRDMSTHHAQAVEMAMIAHAGTTDAEVRTLAADIALTQHGQINIMQTWLQTWGLDLTGSQAPMAWMPDSAGAVVNGLMPGMATPAQMTTLRAATGKDLNVQFLTLMRQHHLGGIHMAEEIVKMSDNDRVVKLAQTMVNSQRLELGQLQELLTKAQAAP
jgi:uncharacterized protein (DUF305 family)